MNHIIALSPTDLVPAQQSLIGWCDQRITHWIAEQKEATDGHKHALANKWNAAPFKRLIQKANRKIGFYKKVRQAIEAGYLIVPNFPLNIFAIRTTAVEARADESSSRWSNFEQSCRVLSPGEGEYRNPLPTKDTYADTNKEGKEVTMYYPTELKDELEIPLHLVKPEIMRAVDKARCLKLFDQIGIATDMHADPIICGQILEGNSASSKRVTFFVAWYVDLDSI
jgi:hypothetical protein